MSYDVYLTTMVDGNEVELCDVGNITWNLSPMFHKAMGVGMGDFRDKNAKEIEEVVSKGVENMKSSPDEYAALNPSNGWGDYDGALRFLEELLYAIRKFPSAIIRVY